MKPIEATLDLFLTAMLADWRPQQAVVVLQSHQSHWPLLDQIATVAWLQRSQPPFMDFSAHPARLPAPRYRITAADAADTTLDLLRRSALAVLALPDSRGQELPALDQALLTFAAGGAAFAGPSAAETSKAPECLIYGAESSSAWNLDWVKALLPRLRPVPAPQGHRIAASPRVLAGLEGLGWSATPPLPGAMQRATAALSPRMAVQCLLATAPGAQALLRVCPSPVACIGAPTEATQWLIQARGVAFFNERGSASVLLPWAKCERARFLIRNIRGSIDGLLILNGERQLEPQEVVYASEGVVLSLDLSSHSPGPNRWLHLGLPKPSWPQKGLCDLGAVEFTAELA